MNSLTFESGNVNPNQPHVQGPALMDLLQSFGTMPSNLMRGRLEIILDVLPALSFLFY